MTERRFRTLGLTAAATASLVVCAAADDGGRMRAPALIVENVRDLNFGRVTVEAAGSVSIAPGAGSVVQTSGGVMRLTGGSPGSARFAVRAGARAKPDDVIVITVPQTIRMEGGGRRWVIEDISADLDGDGRDWKAFGAGRYLCTMSEGRCAFSLGGRIRLDSAPQTTAAGGGFSISASLLSGDDDRDERNARDGGDRDGRRSAKPGNF